MPGEMTTCDVKVGWGGANRSTNNACRLVEQLDVGRPPVAGALLWSHYIDLASAVDIRDGLTRTAGSDSLTYADGDEVRIPTGTTNKYVVVAVVSMNLGDVGQYKRAYLLRDTLDWTVPAGF